MLPFGATLLDTATHAFQIQLAAACYRRFRARRSWEYERRVATRLRDWLYRQLGGKCERCSETDPSEFSIDHQDGRSWSVNLAWAKRIKRYVAEFKAGVRLRILCLRCHGRRSRRAQLKAKRRRSRRNDRQLSMGAL